MEKTAFTHEVHLIYTGLAPFKGKGFCIYISKLSTFYQHPLRTSVFFSHSDKILSTHLRYIQLYLSYLRKQCSLESQLKVQTKGRPV